MAAVRFQLEGSVGHIVLSNPPKNLVGSAFAVDLRSALQAASKSDIRVLLVRAEGPNFGAGGDVSDFLKMDFDSWRTFIADANSAYRSIEALMIRRLRRFEERLSNGATRSYAAIRALLKTWAGSGVAPADTLLLDITMGLYDTEDAKQIRIARLEGLRSGTPMAAVAFHGR
jgi:hypothetical protein